MRPPVVESRIEAPYAAWIEIRLDHLLHDLRALKAFCPAQTGSSGYLERAEVTGLQPVQTEVLAVIKANAYGHGLLQIARALDGKVRYLGVSSLRELLELKENHVQTPVFVFGRLAEPELRAALMDGVTLSVSSLDEALEISAVSGVLKRRTPVHMKVDTGMGRFGIPFRDALKTIEKIAALPALELEGLYTHFPTAEIDDGFAEKQLLDFALLTGALERKNIRFRYRHSANSAGILKRPHPLMNMVRPGLLLYGIHPDPALKPLIQTLPVLSLKSRILLVKNLAAGETAGYGREFSAKKNTRIAMLAVGYSHGYPFNAARAAEVLLRGKRCKLAGRISMDYMAVHLGDTEAARDEEVTLIGECQGDQITVEEVAGWAGTIPYEIVTGLLNNLPRVYIATP